MSDAPLIQPATTEDLRTLAVDLATQPLFSAYGNDATSLGNTWVRALNEGQSLLVARQGKNPVGLCWFSPQGAFGRAGYLRLIAVATAAQGAGLGTRLLRAYEVGCGQPAGGWFLLTSDFNSGAQRFYERHGYRCVGEIPGFVKPNISERIYWKPRAPAP